MKLDDNKEAVAMLKNTLGSIENRFREAYNKGYKDGLRDGASQVTAKLVSKILEETEADTPQTEEFKNFDREALILLIECQKERIEELLADKDTPQTDWHYDEQDATWYPYKHEDEPQQKSCATCKHALGNWDGESDNCGRCCGADRRFYEPKTESQTERKE